MTMHKPKIAILGAGAMGCLFGGVLKEGGLDITLIDVWQDHVNAINNHGLKIIGYDGARVIAVRAVSNPHVLNEIFDVVLVQCKAIFTQPALKSIEHLMGDETVVVSFQNGLGNEDIIAEMIGHYKVMGGLTAHGASVEGPGVIRDYAQCDSALETYIGEMDGGLSERAMGLAKLLTENGLPTIASDDIKYDMWKKLLANIGMSPTSAICNLNVAQMIQVESLVDTVHAAIDEAVLVAAAEGIQLDAKQAYDFFAKIAGPNGAAENKSSACFDILNQRQTEVDFINGTVVRLGKKHGIPTPVNSTLVSCVKGLESHYLS